MGQTLDNNIPSPKSYLGDNICAMPITIETSLKAIHKEKKQTERKYLNLTTWGWSYWLPCPCINCNCHSLQGSRVVATALELCFTIFGVPCCYNFFLSILRHSLYQVTCIVFFDVHSIPSCCLGEKSCSRWKVCSHALVEMEKLH